MDRKHAEEEFTPDETNEKINRKYNNEKMQK